MLLVNFNIHVNMTAISIWQECVTMECLVSLRTKTAAVASAAAAKNLYYSYLQSLHVILYFTSIITHPLPDLVSPLPSWKCYPRMPCPQGRNLSWFLYSYQCQHIGSCQVQLVATKCCSALEFLLELDLCNHENFLIVTVWYFDLLVMTEMRTGVSDKRNSVQIVPDLVLLQLSAIL